jgi:UDP-3-O-[3-hydroxymyristoyl] N-acetylglucosamine deacetylase
VEGVGLHTGRQARVVIEPARAGAGIAFTDGSVVLPLSPGNVVDTRRCTTLGSDGMRVATVEHLLAALHGLAVDNVTVRVDGPELPVLDGSAASWARAILEAGLGELDVEAVALAPQEVFVAMDGDSVVSAVPADRFRIACVTHYDHPMLGLQAGSFACTPSAFKADLAPARTFGFEFEVESLRRSGMALGGALDNALVIYQDRYSTPLRFPDECLRHKVVDVLGDLYVIGRRLKAAVFAVRPGHSTNALLARRIWEAAGSAELCRPDAADGSAAG